MKNSIVISFRIDTEISDSIAFLKLHNIRYTAIIREAIREALNKKCKEFKKRSKNELLPF